MYIEQRTVYTSDIRNVPDIYCFETMCYYKSYMSTFYYYVFICHYFQLCDQKYNIIYFCLLQPIIIKHKKAQ